MQAAGGITVGAVLVLAFLHILIWLVLVCDHTVGNGLGYDHVPWVHSRLYSRAVMRVEKVSRTIKRREMSLKNMVAVFGSFFSMKLYVVFENSWNQLRKGGCV